MNKLLQRQIEKYLGAEFGHSAELASFLKVIGESYDHYEKDRKMLERSIELSSNEMIELNNKIRKESEELNSTELNEAQQIAKLGSWIFDKGEDKTLCSEELYSILERVPGGILLNFKGILQCMHPDDRARLDSVFEQSLSTHKPFSNEARIVTPDGQVKNILVQAKIIENENGELIRVHGTVQDITEQKQAEIALQKANSQIQTLFENIEEVFFSVDMLHLQLLQISPSCEKVYGCPRQDFINNPMLWQQVILDEDEKVIDANNALMYAGKSFVHEHKIHYKNETIRWLETKISPTLNKEGQLIRIDGITSNITQRRQAEESLKQTMKEASDYRYALDESSIVSITDQKGIIKYVNNNFCKISGFSQEELIGQDHYINNSGYHSKEFIRDLWTTIAKGKIWRGEIRNKTKDGDFYWLDTTIIPFVNDKGHPVQYLSLRTDITERKAVEEALKANNSELKKTNSELDKFVYSVSHDLRAPLTSMLGIIEMSEEATKDDIAQKHLAMLKKSVKKLDGFILDILDYSRNARMEVKNEKINFHELLEDITGNLKYMSTGNRRVDIRTTINNGVLFTSDKGRLGMILNNLISNAIRYQNPNEKTPFIEILVNLTPDKAHIEIKDNGIGISKENHEKVFDMFYRVSNKSVGSGLGLYIVKETVDKLNGKIEIASELDKGTTFTIQIPNN